LRRQRLSISILTLVRSVRSSGEIGAALNPRCGSAITRPSEVRARQRLADGAEADRVAGAQFLIFSLLPAATGIDRISARNSS